jgi:hypothetical protein
MSVLTGHESLAGRIERDPIVGAVRDAVLVARALVAPIERHRAEDGAELAASLAIMECCATEAAIERGRVRRKLLEIARAKAARACAAIDVAVAWRAVAFFDVADARAALEDAERALTRPEPTAIFAFGPRRQG